jgi:ATP-dependent DNA ligase
MPLLRLPEPFDHPDWLFEVKHDGFRALAHIDGHYCNLVSRNGHTFKHGLQLCEELALAVKARDAVIDGEIVWLDARGRSDFKSLLFRRDWPFFYPFDLLAVDGEDLREWPLVERKRRLRRLIPSVPTRLLYVDHVEARGRDFFEVACAHDLGDIVGKLASGRCHADGASTNWIKLIQPDTTRQPHVLEPPAIGVIPDATLGAIVAGDLDDDVRGGAGRDRLAHVSATVAATSERGRNVTSRW